MMKDNKIILVIFLLFTFFSNKTYAQYTLTDDDVVVTDGIIESCSYGFANTNIIIPSTLDGQTVTGIEYYSSGIFENKGLTGLQLPSTLEDIPTDGFKNNSITSITIPASLTSLGQYVFENNSLSSLVFEDGIKLTTIPRQAFASNLLSTVTIPSSVKTITYHAFALNELTEVIFEENSELATTGIYAFIYNEIASLTLPKSVITISDYCFQDNQLSSINIPLNVETIGSYSFANNQLTSVTFDENCHITTIESNAFTGNTGLTSITLPAPIQEGYVFLHWIDDNNVTYDAGDQITDYTIEYTAIFEENTTTIQDVTTCDSYISPSGNYTWTSSGTYLDTLTNSTGEDSVITTNLTILYSSTSTLDINTCDSYTSPSGNYTWTSSGTYRDTIPNHVGCDSIITINLIVNYSSNSTLFETTCDSYTSPSGNHTWTSSGTYQDIIQNHVGCDSTITIYLTINNSSSSSISENVCDSYMSPSGKYTWTNSGVYKDTISNYEGCDSIITIDLIVEYSTISTITETAVDSYTSPSGNYIWTNSGTYLDTIPNSVGCDSIITINLTVNTSSSSSITATSCDSYMSPSGNYSWTSSGTYLDTVPNSMGCDSVITIYLTILNSTYATVSETVCDLFTSPSGNYTWVSSGIYLDTIPNSAECDSIITINLTVNASSSSSITATSCDSYISPSGNYSWTSSGIYKDTIENYIGCDSIITVNLTIIPVDEINIVSQNDVYEINEDGGSLSFTTEFSPISSSCEIEWFIEGDTHLASFSDGTLTACGCGDGEITLIARLIDNPNVYGEKTILITNQISGLITNSTFDNNIDNWFLWTPDCNNSAIWENGQAKIILGNNGDECWSQFMTSDYMTVEEGITYRVTFDAYASTTKNMYCVLRYNGEDYHTISPEKEFELSTDKQSFSFKFTMNETTCNIAQIHFNVGGNNENIWIDNVSICELEQSNVTFQVNMQNEDVADNVILMGSWDSWTDPYVLSANGNVYSATIPLEPDAYIEYKFVNSSSATDYNNYEIISGDCTSNEGNRFFTVPDTDTTLGLFCFGACEDCTIPELSIKEIQGENETSSYQNHVVQTSGVITGVNQYGCFIQDANDYWSGIYVYNSDFSTRQIGEGLNLTAKVIEYNDRTQLSKVQSYEFFEPSYTISPINIENTSLDEKYEGMMVELQKVEAINKNSNNEWEVIFPTNDTILIDNYLYQSELVENTYYNITGIVDHQYNTFSVNPRNQNDIVKLNYVSVTFQVDMQNEEVSETGVYLNGNFANWSTSEMPEMDASETIYSTTVTLETGDSIQYKYINGFGEDWSGYETVTGSCIFSEHGNRLLVVPYSDTTLNIVCFGSCDICSEETGLNFTLENTINIYPNPADNIVYVDFKKAVDAKISLIDILGRKVYEKLADEAKESIQLETYHKGIYFLIIDYGTSTNTYKLIIQ